MANPKHLQTSSTQETHQQLEPRTAEPPTTELTEDQLARWARLVADGQGSPPDGLGAHQHQQFLLQVRQLRRVRLVRYIARQLAMDIHRQATGQHGG